TNPSRKNIYSVAFSSDGKVVAAGEYAAALSSVVFWDALTGKEINRLINNSAHISVAFAPDGSLAFGGRSKTVWIHDQTRGKIIKSLEHEGAIEHTIFSSDGK